MLVAQSSPFLVIPSGVEESLTFSLQRAASNQRCFDFAQNDKNVKICDLTQFYSPLSGGVKRYLHEKIAYISNGSSDDAHVLIVPGSKTEVTTDARSRIYSIRSPLVSRSSRYRALLNLRAIEEILERERPDLIESSDPYQIGWKAIAAGRALRVPVVGFYHSHFRSHFVGAKFGKRGTQRQ